MKLIQLSCECYVQSDQIAEVKLNPHAETVTVRTKDGIGHVVFPEHREPVYSCLHRLVQAIDEANNPKPVVKPAGELMHHSV